MRGFDPYAATRRRIEADLARLRATRDALPDDPDPAARVARCEVELAIDALRGELEGLELPRPSWERGL